MMMTTRNPLLPAALIVLATWGGAGCSRTPADQAARAGRPVVAVEAAVVRSGELPRILEVAGSLAPKREAEVKSETSGTVTEVLVTEWAPVRRGDPLARLDPREANALLAAAHAAVLQAEVAEARAARELERSRRLRESGLATQQSLDDARTAREAAAAATAAARAQLAGAQVRLDKTTLRAPLDGEVAYRGVDVGDYVESMGAREPMFRIVDNRRLELTVTVPSARMDLVQPGQTIVFTTEAVPGRDFTGTIRRVNPAVDEATRAVKVMADVENADGALRGGLFVHGRLDAGARVAVLQVPRGALLTWDVAARQAEVYTVAGDLARRCRIETGDTAGDLVEVVAGLTAGERVVTRGAFNVRDGDRLKVTATAGE